MRNHAILQPRDLTLIRLLANEFLLLTREQIAELVPMGSISRLNFRLKRLRDSGYLSARSIWGSASVVQLGYYLGLRAVEIFPDPDRPMLRRRIAEAGDLKIAGLMHRMLVDSVHIRFLTAGRDYSNYKFLTWVDQYSPWWQKLREYGVPIQADAYAEYIMLLNFDGLMTLFLELDRGTERGENIRSKIDRYVQFAASGLFEQKFAASTPFRVLFITTGKERLESVLKLIEQKTDKTFWLATWQDFKNSKLFDAYWRRPHKPGSHSMFIRP